MITEVDGRAASIAAEFLKSLHYKLICVSGEYWCLEGGLYKGVLSRTGVRRTLKNWMAEKKINDPKARVVEACLPIESVEPSDPSHQRRKILCQAMEYAEKRCTRVPRAWGSLGPSKSGGDGIEFWFLEGTPPKAFVIFQASGPEAIVLDEHGRFLERFGSHPL